MIEQRQEGLNLPTNSTEQMKTAWSKDWVVYAKKPFSGPEQILEYLGRYTSYASFRPHLTVNALALG